MEAKSNGARGFTLIEVIVVVAVIAIVASIAVPLAAVMEDRARLQATREELGHLSDALLSYWEDRGAFPDSLPQLESAGYVSGQTDPEGYRRDAWHRDYTYARAGLSATLASSGPDFSFGTADDVDLVVTAAAVAREETRDEVATIHVALRNYETQRVPALLPDLPPHWDVQGVTPGAFAELVSEGLLPNEIRFLTDAWGSTYVYGGTPADYVTSPNL